MAARTYAIVWQQEGESARRAGRLELGHDHFALHGGSGEREAREHVSRGDIVAVQPYSEHRLRLASQPTIRILRHVGPPLLIAGLASIGATTELFEALMSGLTSVPLGMP